MKQSIKNVMWLVPFGAATLLLGQSTPSAPKPSAAKAATKAAKAVAAKASPRVAEVIDALKGGLTETLILQSLRTTNAPISVSLPEMQLLKAAGASDTLIGAMQNPASVAAVAAAPAPVAPSAPVAATVAAAPAPSPAPQAAPQPPVATASAATPATPRAQKIRVGVTNFKFSAQKQLSRDDLGLFQVLYGGAGSGIMDTSTVGASISAQFIDIVSQSGKLVPVALGDENKQAKMHRTRMLQAE
jgi:hypothetical protein